jgi:hypothetical protein
MIATCGLFDLAWMFMTLPPFVRSVSSAAMIRPATRGCQRAVVIG